MKYFAGFFVLLLAFGPLGGCETTPKPDYTIQVAPTPDGQGMVAVPPHCANWSDNGIDVPLDNQPLPEFGCADARNFAIMVDRPEDLLQGRNPGPANGVTTAGSILRYNNNQTRGLIYPSQATDNSVDTTTASSSASSLSGETPPPSGSSSGK
jgi:hypothetical protein